MIKRKRRNKILSRCKCIGFRGNSQIGYMSYVNDYGNGNLFRQGCVMKINKRKSLKEKGRYSNVGWKCFFKLKSKPSRKVVVYDMTNYG